MQNDVSIVLCGEAGQGIQTIERLLTRILKLSGYNVFATKEYMSRVRGGVNSTSIRVSSEPVSAYIDRIDILIPLTDKRTKHLERRISKKTLILNENISTNMDAIGMVCGILKVEINIIEDYIHNYFAKKGEKIISDNITAAKQGYEYGAKLKYEVKIKQNKKVGEDLLINGAEAVGLGAIAGGCNFISAYPMSPSTGVLVFLSQQAKEFGIIAEQAEDEIAAMNMSLGAWYAGARALVSTSGGGFALMEEGLSLSGMLESPVVVHLAQRPGPATGLPTRTEQGDLNMALYSGHGEFPRVIFAPGSIEEAYELTQKAFNLADKYQIPVFVLTDQYLMDSYYNIPTLNSNLKIEKHIIKTEEGYKRYALTKNGVSPRGIPGYGKGLVAVDSDEHDEEGHITEDLDLRDDMVEKRLKKLEKLEKESIPPEIIGPKNYKILIVGWGSTYQMIKEAVSHLGRKDIAFLRFKQVYPLSESTIDYLEKAENVILIENNATSQFGNLISLYTGFEIEDRILKYDGLPFSVEEIIHGIEEIIKHG
jgi:2-oxoglutarate ferredoxin oxidoreductase subunit alpha